MLVNEFSFVHPVVDELEQRLEQMAQEPVQELVYVFGAVRPERVYDGNDHAALVRLALLKDDPYPLQFLHGLVGPVAQLPEGQVPHLDLVLDD